MRTILLACVGVAVVGALAGCATVKPQEHATLADPTMRFDDDAHERAQWITRSTTAKARTAATASPAEGAVATRGAQGLRRRPGRDRRDRGAGAGARAGGDVRHDALVFHRGPDREPHDRLHAGRGPRGGPLGLAAGARRLGSRRRHRRERGGEGGRRVPGEPSQRRRHHLRERERPAQPGARRDSR